jgi:hypothetical protein
MVALALGLVAGCGDDAGGTKETKASRLAALEKLPKDLRDDFKKGDTNGDGRIQDAEFTAMIEEDFKASDVDGDGELSGADIRKEFGKDVNIKASLAGMDLDEDGRVPLEEYSKHVERDFMRHMDTNKDGHLDPPEVGQFYQHARTGGSQK